MDQRGELTDSAPGNQRWLRRGDISFFKCIFLVEKSFASKNGKGRSVQMERTSWAKECVHTQGKGERQGKTKARSAPGQRRDCYKCADFSGAAD